ncbi:MAG: dTDP-4-dehydrorhamnose 3,5-epimerase [Bauldia sp.]
MSFSATKLAIPGVCVIAATRHSDARGNFMETYRAGAFAEFGLPPQFVQDNQILSSRAGTIRGLHFQAPPFAQAKLVRVLRGAIFDVAVDIRTGSPTFGKWVGASLSAAAGNQLYIPAGFAHGYSTLEPETDVAYKCDAYYAAAAEGGILFSDPAIGIEWPYSPGDAILSERDRALPLLEAISSPFVMAGRR